MIHERLFVFVFACQDEVIGVSKKVVVRVEHLVKWTCPEPPQWKQNAAKICDLRVLNGSSCRTDLQEVKAKGASGEACDSVACRLILADASAYLWYRI